MATSKKSIKPPSRKSPSPVKGSKQAPAALAKKAAPPSPSRPRQYDSPAPITAITIEVTGRVIDNEVARSLPSLFQTIATRSGAALPGDPFYIDAHLKVARAMDLRAVPPRDAHAAPQKTEQLNILPGQFVAIESDDGLILFTSGARLAEIIGARMPSAVRGGVVSLDTMAEGVAQRSGQDTTRGGLLTKIASFATRLFVLEVDDATDPVIQAAKAWLKQQGEAVPTNAADWGASLLGAKALSYVVEKKLLRTPGLYGFKGDGEGEDALQPITREALATAAMHGPMLVFIHGTASNSIAAYRGLRNERNDWQLLEKHYGGRIIAFEHHTFSASPMENALQLLEAMPGGARLHLVTHSRGGLVGDLLCVDWTQQDAVNGLIAELKRVVTPANKDAASGFDKADAEDKRLLTKLGDLARSRGVVVERYVRVASPANGTLLMGHNFDLFLSVLLNLMQLGAAAATGPAAAVPLQMAKRLVADLVRHRANANVVPGLEAMLPLSSTTKFLAQAPVVSKMALGIIAGDIEGTQLNLKRLVELFTDWTFFDRHDHDLIVDTDSMDAGIARAGAAASGGLAAVLTDQGDGVDHFGYFRRTNTRTALLSWLTAAKPSSVDAFTPLPNPEAIEEARKIRRASRAPMTRGDKPIVVVLPGVMGTYLTKSNECLWTGLSQAFRGCTLDLAWPAATGITPAGVMGMYYDDLCAHLERTHRVELFPYDWRLSVQDHVPALRKLLDQLLSERGSQPVRILAHSMGGLVVRALAATDVAYWVKLLDIPGARVVMLGTPHQGSHAAAGMMIGRHNVLRMLSVAYQGNSLQEHVNFAATLPGAVQMMPRREFIAQEGQQVVDYFDPAFWQGLRTQPGESPKVVDRLFGNGIVGVPSAATIAKAQKLFELPGYDVQTPSMPAADAAEVDRLADRIVMVLGRADHTPIAMRQDDGAWRLVYSANGDGTVPWDSSRIRGIGRAYRVDAEHGDLCDDKRWFDAYEDILETGRTTRAQGEGWPEAATRGGRPVPLVIGEPSLETWPSEASIMRAALGGGRRSRQQTQRTQAKAVGFDLQVSCSAMDLRNATSPVLVGHYEGDPLAGAELTIDKDVVRGELTMRNHLGQYPGPIGSAAIVVLEPSTGGPARGTRRGAVVLGLGEFGSLSGGGVTQAVRAGCLRYMLACIDREGIPADATAAAAAPPLRLELSSLLLGQNSTANISIADSVGAIVRGVVEANHEFQRVRVNARQALIVKLEFVEWYLDAAISATKALRTIAQQITNNEGEYRGVRVTATPTLHQTDSMRQRLEAQEASGYWPRLIVTGRVGGRPWKQMQDQAATTSSGAAPIADSLHFTYLSQRARAEAVVLHRQPGLIEKLAHLSINSEQSSLALGRTLFQLMTPLEFKDTARQIDSLVLVVDAYTANFPWELMVADEEPLIRKTAVVRQFESLTWRQRVRPAMQMSAFVIGDPSTKHFEKHFKGYAKMPELSGAKDEADIVSKALRQGGFQVEEAIGQGVDGIEVIHKLFQRPYRVIHIAAHGMFELRPEGGGPETTRTGVILSDGLLLTAAELRQMEQVPDLVFLNCCHLGVMDSASKQAENESYRLAASISRELIDMGVRAVVAAGWPVDDNAARHFATIFYDQFVAQGQGFGEAVRTARVDTWHQYQASNTWGAFQVYGDPNFMLDPQRLRSSSTARVADFAAPEEAVSALELLTDALHRQSRRQRYDTLTKVEAAVDHVLARCPDAWHRRGNILFAAAGVYAKFGDEGFDKAIEYHLRAVGAPAADARSYPSVRALELLANFEAQASGKAHDEAGVMRAATRLERMAATLSKEPGAGQDTLPPPSADLCELIGRSFKGLAVQRLHDKTPEKKKDGPHRSAKELLDLASDWYGRGASLLDKGHTGRQCAYNQLAIAVITGSAEGTDANLEALATASLSSLASVRPDDCMAEGFMVADVAVLRALLAAKLGDGKTIKQLVARYRECRARLRPTEQQMRGVSAQLVLLADLTAEEKCPGPIKKQAVQLQAIAAAL
jgi:CHAT domain-containing protein/pimeloyl-ACP methyl ester carboxylesterase